VLGQSQGQLRRSTSTNNTLSPQHRRRNRGCGGRDRVSGFDGIDFNRDRVDRGEPIELENTDAEVADRAVIRSQPRLSTRFRYNYLGTTI
jgi:hypothetical protein